MRANRSGHLPVKDGPQIGLADGSIYDAIMLIDYRIFEEIAVAKYEKYVILLEGEMGQHNSPHIHLREKAIRWASVRIDDGEVLAGKIPRDIRKCLLHWLDENRVKLLEDWKQMQIHQRPRQYTFGPC